jgi:hypothetical protein
MTTSLTVNSGEPLRHGQQANSIGFAVVVWSTILRNPAVSAVVSIGRFVPILMHLQRHPGLSLLAQQAKHFLYRSLLRILSGELVRAQSSKTTGAD